MEDVFKILDEIGVAYKRYDHEAAFTCEEADVHCAHIEGPHCKNLFLRDRKGKKHYLVVVPAEKRVDLKRLAADLDEVQLGFASSERLMKYLGLMPGSVSPFGLINDRGREVHLIVDKELWDGGVLNVHPNVNTATLRVAIEDFEKFLAWWGGVWEVREI